MSLTTGLVFLLSATAVPGELGARLAPEVELQIGYRLLDRQIESLDGDNVFVEGEKVLAWTAVAGVSGGFIEHVWTHNGVEVARHYLPVGASQRWRTWSRQTVRAGTYEVRVLAPDGSELRRTTFEVVVEPRC